VIRLIRRFCLLAFALLVLAITGGCNHNFDPLLNPARDQLEQARRCGAPYCRPKAFAAAEAYLDFADNAAQSGNRMDAEVYLRRAEEKIEIAMEACESCNSDLDGDGLVDMRDGDPYRAEDFDGFEDQDGVPDHDNDGDGYLDEEDECPNQPEDFDGFEDNDGCPDVDNDNDGVPDEIDQCPSEPEDMDGFQDEDGCPDPDNDGDGFPDADDACPNNPETINGFLDDDGCPDLIPKRRKFIMLPQVDFLGDAIYLTPASRENLAAFAKRLQKHQELYVRIESHTYSRGNAEAELELTKKRAELIKQILIDEGVRAERLAALGFGGERPIADNATYAGRSKNDRIDFIIYLQ